MLTIFEQQRVLAVLMEDCASSSVFWCSPHCCFKLNGTVFRHSLNAVVSLMQTRWITLTGPARVTWQLHCVWIRTSNQVILLVICWGDFLWKWIFSAWFLLSASDVFSQMNSDSQRLLSKELRSVMLWMWGRTFLGWKEWILLLVSNVLPVIGNLVQTSPCQTHPLSTTWADLLLIMFVLSTASVEGQPCPRPFCGHQLLLRQPDGGWGAG